METQKIPRDRTGWVLISSIILLGIYSFGIVNEFYWILGFPLIILLIIAAIFFLDKLIIVITFLTPFAINLKNTGYGMGISLPTEPIIIGIMLLFYLKLLNNEKPDDRIYKHPISIAIFLNIFWLLVTTITSELPIVSLKFFISKLWFVTVFYFIGAELFKSPKHIKQFIWAYLTGLVGVVFYTINYHSQYGFSEKAAHWVMWPFYNDHTAYAAAIAMFLPITFVFIWISKNPFVKFISLLFAIILTVAMVLSYTRAAWISLIVAFLVYIVLLLRIKFSLLAVLSAVLLIFFFAFQLEIKHKLEKNRQDSSSDFSAHIKSITNISTDASNLERINRWKSALKMFKERPFFGWGPGTYTFLYAPFQNSQDLTTISTNAGTGGNAHSEYIGPLAESGLFGTLTFILIVTIVLYRSIKLYSKIKEVETKLILAGILLGLITYLVHGTLNNFLDTDKASVPFWAFLAMLTIMDIKQKELESAAGN